MKKAILITLTALLLIACAPSGPGVRPDPIEGSERNRIERLLADERHEAAALALVELAERLPDRADRLFIEAAEAWLAGEQAEPAASVLSRVDSGRLSFHDQVRLDLARAELSLLTRDLANAGWLLAHTAERVPESLAERHGRLEQRLETLESHPIRGALEALQEAIDTDEINGELVLALLIEFPASQIEDLLFEAGSQPLLLPWLDLAISAREHLLDDPALAEALSGWESRYPDIGYSAEQAHEWIAAWRLSRPLPDTISVLLPGPDSELYRPGRALRDGLLAAWLNLVPERRPELWFHHLGEDRHDVAATWFEVREGDAEFVIGPLERDHVDRLLHLPDAGLTPTLLLNLPTEPADLDEGLAITALALPPEEEAEMAAIEALARGHRRAIVLAQYTSWGERVSEAFVDTFRLGGGEILQQRVYDRGNADHSFVLTEALEIDRSEERIQRLEQLLGESIEGVAQRRTDVDVIFLAARAEDGRQLAPQLRFFDAGDVALMSTSHIIGGTPHRDRVQDLEGVIAPLAPWFLDYTPAGQQRRAAERLYADLDNPALSRLHALGRDAMNLVAWLQMMRDDPQLRLPGMTGQLEVTRLNRVERKLPFVQIRDGMARPLQ